MKKRISALVAVIVTLTGLWFLQRLVVPKYFGDVTEGAFTAEYYEDEADHDVLFLGDCEAYENFDPVFLWENYGINAYIRGSAQQLVWQSYYMLEDALRYETPKVVVMNVLAMKYNEPQSEAYNRITLEGMKWGLPKIKAIRASMTEEENFVEYLFPILRYHERIFELNEDDFKYFFKKEKVSHNGYYLRVDSKPAENVPGGIELPDYDFGENAWGYLEKIADLCEEKGISLILVKAPSLYPYWYPQWEKQIGDFAKGRGLRYINYLELTEETGLDFATDTYDGGLHLNLYGADKITDHLGQILSSEYKIPDRRNEKALTERWNEKIEFYEADISEKLKALGHTENVTPAPTHTPVVSKDNAKREGYGFKYKGVTIYMDALAKDVLETLPPYDSVYEAPSCAFEGKDRVYSFGSFELNTYETAGVEYISAVIFKDDLVETMEGAFLGMSGEELAALYNDGEKEGNIFVCEKGEMRLRFFITDGVITQIQYLSKVLD